MYAALFKPRILVPFSPKLDVHSSIQKTWRSRESEKEEEKRKTDGGFVDTIYASRSRSRFKNNLPNRLFATLNGRSPQVAQIPNLNGLIAPRPPSVF